LRFRENKIVPFLLDNDGLDLNILATLLPDCREDWEHFAHLIGYWLSDFGELNYVSDETYEAAEAMVRKGLSENVARIDHLESIVERLRRDMRLDGSASVSHSPRRFAGVTRRRPTLRLTGAAPSAQRNHSNFASRPPVESFVKSH
jgi:hypothetical protein